MERAWTIRALALTTGLALLLGAMPGWTSRAATLERGQATLVKGAQTHIIKTHHLCTQRFVQHDCNLKNGMLNCSGTGPCTSCDIVDGLEFLQYTQCRPNEEFVCNVSAMLVFYDCGDKKAGTCQFDEAFETWFCFTSGNSLGPCTQRLLSDCNT